MNERNGKYAGYEGEHVLIVAQELWMQFNNIIDYFINFEDDNVFFTEHIGEFEESRSLDLRVNSSQSGYL